MYRVFCFFFFNDTATTEIYTLSLHDALPILTSDKAHYVALHGQRPSRIRKPTTSRRVRPAGLPRRPPSPPQGRDRKSTRLNSSHANISYAVFCLKKKKTTNKRTAHLIS